MTDWRSKAACLGIENPDIFFPIGGDRDPSLYRPAKRICDVCPVWAECLTDAINNETREGPRDGMRGGMTPDERKSWARSATRKRGVPPASTASIITPDDEATRERMYRAGADDGVIGEAVGRSRKAIASWREQRGYPLIAQTAKTRLPTRILDLYADCYKSGLPDQPIADLAGTTANSVRHWRRRHGYRANPAAQKVTA